MSENPIPINSASGTLSNHTGFRYRIDPLRKLVVVRFGKRVTVEEIGLYSRKLRADRAFDPEFSEIVDLTSAEQLNLEVRDFFKLADRIDPFSPGARRAFVVNTSVQKHAARMHKALRAQQNIEVFSSLEEAERWIDLNE